MNTCKNCKHWGAGWAINEKAPNECGCISLEDSNSKGAAFIDVYVSDDTSLNVKLMTTSTFGCALHSLNTP